MVIIDGLEAQRSRLKLELVDILHSGDLLGLHQVCDLGCRWKDNYLRKWNHAIRDQLRRMSTLSAGTIMYQILSLDVKVEHSSLCRSTSDLSRYGNELHQARRDKITALRAELRIRIDGMCWWKNVPLRDLDSDDSGGELDI